MSGVSGPGVVPDVLLGLRLFGRGARTVLGSRRLLLLGALPALVTSLAYGAGMVLIVVYLDDLAAAAAPFTDGWSPAARRPRGWWRGSPRWWPWARSRW